MPTLYQQALTQHDALVKKVDMRDDSDNLARIDTLIARANAENSPELATALASVDEHFTNWVNASNTLELAEDDDDEDAIDEAQEEEESARDDLEDSLRALRKLLPA